MLSIIISSYNENDFARFSENVADTIGIPYEIIKIHNPGVMGICEAYNKGAAQSKYAYLVFVHEDVIFKSDKWGCTLVKHFQTVENVGVIGVAGATYKPNNLTGWYLPQHTSLHRTNYYQANKKDPGFYEYCNYNPQASLFSEVVVLDGVFLAVKKHVWRCFPFDETLNGFHGYDLDFTLSIHSKFKNIVIFNIDLVHYSLGSPNIDWLRNYLAIHRKHSASLPIHIEDVTSSFEREIERVSLLHFVGLMNSLKLSAWHKMKYFCSELYRTKGKGITLRIIIVFVRGLLL